MENITALAVGLLVVLAGLGLAVGTVAWLWRSLQASGATYVARLDAQESEIDELRRQLHELQKAQIANYALLLEWIAYARRMAAMLREATGQDPPPEPPATSRDATADLGRLASTIARRFSLSEINGLGFDLGQSVADALTGETPAARAQSLVKAAQQRGLLLRLVELCRQERPNGGF